MTMYMTKLAKSNLKRRCSLPLWSVVLALYLHKYYDSISFSTRSQPFSGPRIYDVCTLVAYFPYSNITHSFSTCFTDFALKSE